MSGFFLTYGDSEAFFETGIGKKITGQVAALNSAGLECSIVRLANAGESSINKMRSRLPFANLYPIWECQERFFSADFLYMRRPMYMTGYMIEMLKQIRERNPFVRILLEIPTYPYDKEVVFREDGLPFNLPFLWKDRFWRVRLKGVIDRVVVLNDDLGSLWGIPTLHMRNGVQLDRIEKRTPKADDSSVINMLAVAVFKEWHGYERIIKGLSAYYEERDAGSDPEVNLFLVGEGSELPAYKKLVAELQLEDHVLFLGYLNGNSLDEVYNEAHLSLSSFGGYKKDMFISQELKSREALAKGVPLVSGCAIDVLDSSCPFYLEFPNDESIVDIGQIVQFYYGLRSRYSQEELCDVIRRFAEKTVSVEFGMREVVEYLM